MSCVQYVRRYLMCVLLCCKHLCVYMYMCVAMGCVGVHVRATTGGVGAHTIHCRIPRTDRDGITSVPHPQNICALTAECLDSIPVK